MVDKTAQPIEPANKAQCELPLDYCPVCSKKLESRRCKMVCDRCGYFMSCSEFE